MIVQSLSSFTQGEWGEPELIYFSTELKAIKDEFIHYLYHSLRFCPFLHLLFCWRQKASILFQ